MIRTSLTAAELADYTRKLLASYLPDGFQPGAELARGVEAALGRVAHCFQAIQLKYYQEGGRPVFDHLHGDHFATFLYFVANSVWRDGHEGLAVRLSYLNKIMHGLDLYFAVEMPQIFILVHPVGTVIGRAKYSDYLVVYQNCTVGADGVQYPTIGPEVILYAGSSVIGDCHIGRNVVVGANAMVVNSSVPADSVVVGQYPDHRCLPNRRSVKARCFGERDTPAVTGPK